MWTYRLEMGLPKVSRFIPVIQRRILAGQARQIQSQGHRHSFAGRDVYAGPNPDIDGPCPRRHDKRRQKKLRAAVNHQRNGRALSVERPKPKAEAEEDGSTYGLRQSETSRQESICTRDSGSKATSSPQDGQRTGRWQVWVIIFNLSVICWVMSKEYKTSIDCTVNTDQTRCSPNETSTWLLR